MRTAASTKANSEKMKSQVKVDTTGPMARPIKDSGRRIKPRPIGLRKPVIRTERVSEETPNLIWFPSKVLMMSTFAPKRLLTI